MRMKNWFLLVVILAIANIYFLGLVCAVDTTAPSLTITHPVSSATYATNTIPINFTISDETATSMNCFIKKSDGINYTGIILYYTDWASLGSIANGSTYTSTSVFNGNHNQTLYINCSDGTNENVSEVNFTINVHLPESLVDLTIGRNNFTNVSTGLNSNCVNNSWAYNTTNKYCPSAGIDDNVAAQAFVSKLNIAAPRWWQVDLDSTYWISQVNVLNSFYNPGKTSIQVSTDGNTWTNVSDYYLFQYNTNGAYYNFTFPPVQAAYVRFVDWTGGGSTFNMFGFGEIEVIKAGPYLSYSVSPNLVNGHIFRKQIDTDLSSQDGFQAVNISLQSYGDTNISLNGVNYTTDYFGNFSYLLTLNETNSDYITIVNMTQTTGGIVNSSVLKYAYDKNNYKRYYVSFDDFILNLFDVHNQTGYTSIFNNSFFNFTRYMHNRYGTKFSLYLFYNFNTSSFDASLGYIWNVSNMTNRFASEFENNSDWLRFGYHAYNITGTFPSGITGDSVYNWTRNAVINFTGTNKSWIDFSRHTSWSIARATMRNYSSVGYRGMLVRDPVWYEPPTNNYFTLGYTEMSTNLRREVNYSDYVYDPDESMFFIGTDLWLESTNRSIYNESLAVNDTIVNRVNDSYIFEMFTHDNKNFVSTGYQVYLESAVGNLTANNYTPAFYNEGFLGAVGMNISVSNSSAGSNYTFFYNLTGGGVNTNCSLLFDNVINQTRGMNNKSLLYNFTINNVAVGAHTWNISCWDTSNNQEQSSLASFNGVDLIAPVINLTSPLTGASYSGSSYNVNFTFNVTDDSNISNCSVYVNNVGFLNSSAIVKSAFNSIILNLAASSYTAYVNCTDFSFNIGNSSSISFTITAPAGGNGGGGSGGGGVIHIINDNQFQAGYSAELFANDRVKFFVNNETHIVLMNSVNPSYIIVNVSSITQQKRIQNGFETIFELTGDRIYDLRVKYNNYLAGGKANVTVTKINFAPAQPPEARIRELPSPDVNNPELKEDKLIRYILLSLAMLILLIAGIITYLLCRKGRRPRMPRKYRARRHRRFGK
jgi:hypothetical protein